MESYSSYFTIPTRATQKQQQDPTASVNGGPVLGTPEAGSAPAAAQPLPPGFNTTSSANLSAGSPFYPGPRGIHNGENIGSMHAQNPASTATATPADAFTPTTAAQSPFFAPQAAGSGSAYFGAFAVPHYGHTGPNGHAATGAAAAAASPPLLRRQRSAFFPRSDSVDPTTGLMNSLSISTEAGGSLGPQSAGAGAGWGRPGVVPSPSGLRPMPSMMQHSRSRSSSSAVMSAESDGVEDATKQPETSEDETIPTAIVIKNIPFSLKKESLMEIFVTMDAPRPYALNYHFDQGVFRGLAFANFYTVDETRRVLMMLNGIDVQGRKLRVELKRLLPAAEREKAERDKRERKLQEEQKRFKRVEIDMNDPSTLEIYSKLLLFRDDPAQNAICRFSDNVNTRRIIDVIAGKFGLVYSVEQDGDEGVIVVSRGSRRMPYPPAPAPAGAGPRPDLKTRRSAAGFRTPLMPDTGMRRPLLHMPPAPASSMFQMVAGGGFPTVSSGLTAAAAAGHTPMATPGSQPGSPFTAELVANGGMSTPFTTTSSISAYRPRSPFDTTFVSPAFDASSASGTSAGRHGSASSTSTAGLTRSTPVHERTDPLKDFVSGGSSSPMLVGGTGGAGGAAAAAGGRLRGGANVWQAGNNGAGNGHAYFGGTGRLAPPAVMSPPLSGHQTVMHSPISQEGGKEEEEEERVEQGRGE